jgi:CubicO group peptidase (beta-lactamase class C family)
VDLSAFGSGVTPEHMAWYGVVVDGVNYLGGCQTRAGTYPYCEWMRQPSYSVAKSTFPSLALMRLAQVFGPQVSKLLIKDYIPEAAESRGNWDEVTFNHALDMATGNYDSAEFMVDDNSPKMNEFFGSSTLDEHINHALNWPNQEQPGRTWVYRTSDTFLVTRAMQNYLQYQTGRDEDIYDYVVEQIYQPIGLGPGAYTSMRTSDNNWQGQAEGGYGLWWIPDDIAKLTTFLLLKEGKVNGEQVLHPDFLKAALQKNPQDRGLRIGNNRFYNNAFWAQRFGMEQGFSCEFYVVDWQGISGNVVALMPNGVIYYYFSDNQEFVIFPAVISADRIHPFCP